MKSLYIILFATFLCAMAGMAKADTITVDPNIKPVQILNCVLPTERENNDPLDVSEILKITWFIGSSSGNYNQSIDTNDCNLSLDTTQYPDGNRYIAATATDTDLRQSVVSEESIMAVKRDTPPAQMAAPAFVD